MCYPKGSKLNVFSSSEYQTCVEDECWTGGWTECGYYDANGTIHSRSGVFSIPYEEEVYSELYANGMWIGGWVEEEDYETPRYISTDGISYREIGNASFGTQANPVSLDVFEEMGALGIWNGGWIRYPDSTVLYANANGDSSGNQSTGCGSGDEGEGCGSSTLDGAYLTSGSANYIYAHDFITHSVSFEWGNGVFDALSPEPSLTLNSATISGANFTHMVSISWDSPYRVKFTCSSGSGLRDFYYDIPFNYHTRSE